MTAGSRGRGGVDPLSLRRATDAMRRDAAKIAISRTQTINAINNQVGDVSADVAILKTTSIVRKNTKANWLALNPILQDGEFAFETDTGKFKIGDGTSRYVQLTYPAASTGADGASAYAIAVENGFVGDEAAWLDSLVGDPGETAPPYRANILAADWVGSEGDFEISIPQATHLQEVTKYLTVFFFDSDNVNQEVTYSVSGAGEVILYSDLVIEGYVIISSLQTTAGGAESPSWTALVTTWSTAPAFVTDVVGGAVYSYTSGGTTLYRFVPAPYDSALDAFYSAFSDPDLTGLIVARG